MSLDMAGTSDYRRSQQQPQAQTSYTPIASTASKKRTYASVAVTVPSREQAIIMNAVEGIRISDYVINLGKIIGAKSIISASRISNNRICMYLVSKETVTNVVENLRTLDVNSHEVAIRRLCTPAKRVIISNVFTELPNEPILNEITKLGFKPVSPISTLRAGMRDDEYAHILSFRRQIYVQLDENIRLPTSVDVTYEDISYHIFLSYDDMTCFLCKQQGHIANNCSNVPRNGSQKTADLQHTTQDPQSDNIPTPEEPKEPLPETQAIPLQESVKFPATEEDIQHEHPTTQSMKRQLSTCSSETATSQSTSSHTGAIKKQMPPPMETPPIKPQKAKTKKRRTSATQVISEEAQGAIDDILNTAHFSISQTNFKAFLENSFGNPNPLSEAQRFTDNTDELVRIMYVIYPHLPDRALKNRISRLIHKLKEQIKDQDSNMLVDYPPTPATSIENLTVSTEGELDEY